MGARHQNMVRQLPVKIYIIVYTHMYVRTLLIPLFIRLGRNFIEGLIFFCIFRMCVYYVHIHMSKENFHESQKNIGTSELTSFNQDLMWHGNNENALELSYNLGAFIYFFVEITLNVHVSHIHHFSLSEHLFY